MERFGCFITYLREFIIIFILFPSCAFCTNKCCPKNQYLSNNLECVEFDFVNLTEVQKKTIEESTNSLKNYTFCTKDCIFPCPNFWPDLKRFSDYQILENDTIVHGNKSTLIPKYEYCVDLYEVRDSFFEKVVYSCSCVREICIFKCCLPGHEMTILKENSTNTETAKCIENIDKTNEEWDETKLNKTEALISTDKKYKFQTCEGKENSFLLNLVGNHKYSLQNNGSIVSYDFGVLIGKHDYCGDMYTTTEGKYEPILIACVSLPEPKKKVLIYGILNNIGSVFLLVTIVLHIWLPELAGLPGMCLTNHASCLVVALTCNTINQFSITSPTPDLGCCFLAYLMQFSYLTSFFWLNIMCLDMSLAFRLSRQICSGNRQQVNKKRFALYSLYSWGGGLLITLLTLIAEYGAGLPIHSEYKPNIGLSRCWFQSDHAIGIYFYGPMSVLLLVNFCLFNFTIYRIWTINRGTKILSHSESGRNDRQSKPRADIERYFIYMKIFSLMGICWIMEIVSWLAAGAEEIWYFTDSINSLRGFFIFLIFCWKPKVWHGILKKFPSLRTMMEKLKQVKESEETREKESESKIETLRD